MWGIEQSDSKGCWVTCDRQLNLERAKGRRIRRENKLDEGDGTAIEMFQQTGMIR
jgi:hypothetical protein